ncbi:MAG TPA: hypothetical protein VGE97_09260 [Nitrososphaera sp.]|jgi:hypothetical protein
MALTVKVNLEGYPQGKALGIIGIGAVRNGESVEVDEAGEAAFFSANNNTIENVLKDQEGMEVSGSGTFQTPEGWEPPAPPEDVVVPPGEAKGTGAQPASTQSGLPQETSEPSTEGGA